MNTFDKFKKYSMIAILFTGVALTACSDDDDDDNVTPVTNPPVENEEEVITDVKLVFTNVNDTMDVVEARAQDPDGEGVQELQVLDTIRLDISKTYELTYEIFNNLETPGEDIGDEIAEEDDEHQFFYGFTNNAFLNPLGDGNIDTASDPVNYEDEDSDAQDGSGNPVGLVTRWTTSALATSNGSFRVVLNHLPDIKSSTSSVNDGDSDIDLEFVLEIN